MSIKFQVNAEPAHGIELAYKREKEREQKKRERHELKNYYIHVYGTYAKLTTTKSNQFHGSRRYVNS